MTTVASSVIKKNMPIVQSGLANAQGENEGSVTFNVPFNSVPNVTINPLVTGTSITTFIREVTISSITRYGFTFREIAYRISDKTYVAGSDSCSWIAVGN